MNTVVQYRIYFKPSAGDEQLIFETDSKDRAIYGADLNFSNLTEEGQVYVKYADEIIHTAS